MIVIRNPIAELPFSNVENLAFAHGPDVISDEGEDGGGVPLSNHELYLEPTCRIAMNHGPNIPLFETLFAYVMGEDDSVQFFDHAFSL